MNLSIVVPVYKGETFIEPLVAQPSETLPTFSKKYEVILVNDGSPDNSWSVVQNLARMFDGSMDRPPYVIQQMVEK